jgi:hypothetical protein
MPSAIRSRHLSRLAAAACAVVALAAASVVSPDPASATTQPVTVVTSVNGVVGAPAFSGGTTTVGFAVTNRSTKGAKLGLFSIVVPPGITNLATAGVVGPGPWTETILRCGKTRNCSAIVLAAAVPPLSTSVVPPGGIVTASISFRAPARPCALKFPMIGIGNGIFTVSGPTPSVTVLNGTVAKFGVALSPPAVAGAAATITVTSLNAANQVVPFSGGPITLTLASPDPAASVQGTAFGPGGSAVVTAPPSPTGVFTLSAVFTKAQTQGVQVQSGALGGTSTAFPVASSVPAALALTSITDTSQTPALPTPAANAPFAVGFTAYDAFGNIATTAGVPVTLSTLNAAGGTLDPSTPTGTTGADGTGVISATYSVAQTGLQLQVSSPGLTPGTGTTDVAFAGDSANGTPGVPEELAAGDASADLPNGSFGPVFLTTAPCFEQSCGQGVEITLDGTFTSDSTHLYSNEAPANLSWTCSVQVCPHTDANPPSESSRFAYPPVYDAPQQIQDFNDFPVQVSLKVNGVYQPFSTATPCRDLDDESQVGLTGAIVTETAQADGFCVDVFAITRTNNDFNGDLTIPVLFVEDPKMRPS